MKLRLNKKAGFVLAVAGATAVGSISTAAVMAAIPDTNNVISGCYLKSNGLFDGKGTVRIIDSATDTCKSNENAITWNQTGPKGDKGDPGEGAGPGSGPIAFRTDLDNSTIVADLSDHDLTHRTFKGVYFGHYDSTNVDFSYSVFENTASNRGDLARTTDSEFIHADMSKMTLMHNEYIRANFTDANLSGHNGTDPDSETGIGPFSIYVQHSNMTNTNLSNNNFINAGFIGTDLSSANLTGSTWSNTICPDGTNSDSHGSTCIGHLIP